MHSCKKIDSWAKSSSPVPLHAFDSVRYQKREEAGDENVTELTLKIAMSENNTG